MKMEYIYKATHEDGRVNKGFSTCEVNNEEEGKGFVETWNRQGRFGAFPKWEYKLVKFESEEPKVKLENTSMRTKCDCIVFHFIKDCECSPGFDSEAYMTINSILESGTPMCSECEEEYHLDYYCEVRE